MDNNNNNNNNNLNQQYDYGQQQDNNYQQVYDQQAYYDYYQQDPNTQYADPNAQYVDPNTQYVDSNAQQNLEQTQTVALDSVGNVKKSKKNSKDDDSLLSSDEKKMRANAKKLEREKAIQLKKEKADAKRKAKSEKIKQKIKKEEEKSSEEINVLKTYDPNESVENIKMIKSIAKQSDAKAKINTELVLNIKKYNNYIDYLPSDFTEKMVFNSFIIRKKMKLPKKAKMELRLYPNDTERFLKVVVIVDSYIKQGVVINQTKMFEPFWIIGFETYTLMVTQERPVESKYRINNVNAFAYAQTQNMRTKRISSRRTNKRKSNFQVEQDFIRARENKNWYIKEIVDTLNRQRNKEWECHPRIYINWSLKTIRIDLYLKIDTVKQDLRKTKWKYIDSFTVKAKNVLEIPKKTKIVDIDTLMYLIALNAIYKNIKIFSYNTLYEAYKIIAAEVMSRGFKLKPISKDNLSSLKIVDFSTHFTCRNTMFNDSILHIMNLMSSHEEYYRMKYAYTVQKNPSLLFSDFIVKEFKEAKTNELSTIIKNQEEEYWNEQIKKLDEINTNIETRNKDYYINNYNVLDLTNNAYKDVESYLMGVIKGEKDEITRIMKLGEEILRIDEDPRFTKKEKEEMKRFAKKLDENYKDLFMTLSKSGSNDIKKVKPIKYKDPTKKKKKKNKNKQENTDEFVEQQQVDGQEVNVVEGGVE